MTHHRCSRCKQESYPRNKYKKSGVAGVFCDRGISELRGRGYSSGFFGRLRRKVSDLWDSIRSIVNKIQGKQPTRHQMIANTNRSTHRQLKVMEAKARNMPRALHQTMGLKH